MHACFLFTGMVKRFIQFCLFFTVYLSSWSFLFAQRLVNGNLNTGALSSNAVSAPVGYNWSEVQDRNASAGFGANVSANLSLADDFTIPAGNWTITKITVFAYSTGYTGTGSPFSELRFRLFDEDPSAGSPIPVFGNLTTNRLSSSAPTNLYRIFNGAPGTTRKIWKLEANVNIPVTGGDYWMEWQNAVLNGINSNFTPPSTILRATTESGYNAKQHDLVTGDWSDVTDAGSGDPLDFHFIINFSSSPCSGLPDLGNTITTLPSVCPGSEFELGVSGSVEGTGVTYQWQSSSDGTLFTDIDAANSITLTTSQVSTTFYRLSATCTASGQTGYAVPVRVDMNNPIDCYCIPDPSECSLESIVNLTLGNINNSSTICNVTGYQNYISSVPPAQILSGSNTPVRVGVSAAGSVNVGIWIDYNRNGNFESTEFTPLGNASGSFVQGNISVPSTNTGYETRMRIRVSQDMVLSGNDACSPFEFGETEDYLVHILPPVLCTGTPAPGNTLSTLNTICPGVHFTLSTTNDITSSNITYQWQSSRDGQTFSDILGANSVTLTTSLMDTTWYRLLATCLSNIGISAPIKVSRSALNNCYCIPPSSNCNEDQITNVSIATLNNPSACSNSGYSDYTSIAPVALTKGNTYPLSIDVLAGRTEYVGAWIDFDHSGSFEPSEFVMSGTGNGITISGNIIIPQTALLGLTRMRVRTCRNFPLTAENACSIHLNADPSAGLYNETEDYLVEIMATPACSGITLPGNTIASVPSACSGINFTLSTTGNINFNGLVYQWQSSSGGVTFQNISGANSFNLTTQQSSAIYYRLLTVCGVDSAYSTAMQVTMAPLTECHCIPSVTDCSQNDKITKVKLSTINNSSDCSANGYGDYSHTITPPTLTIGEGYPLQVAVGGGGNEKVSGWIDYNQNGIYETSEYFNIGSGSASTLNYYLLIPRSALAGTTKMRIRVRWNTPLSANDACLAYNYGETEDYALNLVAPSTCSGQPDAGNTVSTQVNICPNADFTLSPSTNINLTGMSYQWQSSVDGINFTSISGATNMNYTRNQTMATWYRMVATCLANSDTSVPLKINMTPLIECYCVPDSSNCSFDDVITNVQIGTLNNNSSCSAKGYQNYSSSVTSVQLLLDSTYDMTVEVGTGSGELKYVGVWMDYNQNGNFDPAEFTNLGSTGGGEVSGRIRIPAHTLSGFTKMRVRVRFLESLNSSDACLYYTYGETEDYKVTIFCRNPQIQSDPISTTQLCGQSSSFNINATGSGLSYLWQRRSTPSDNFSSLTDGVIYSGSNSSSLIINHVTDAMSGSTYRCIVYGCGVSDTSAPAILTVTPITASVTPVDASICEGGSVELAVAGGLLTPSTIASFSSGNINTAIPDNATIGGISNIITVSGLPANAEINSLRVKINATHNKVGDLVMVLKAPNGKIINLGYLLTGSLATNLTTGLVNTVFSSNATLNFQDGADDYTGTFLPDASTPGSELPNDNSLNPFYPLPDVASGPEGFTPDVTDFSELYSVGNGDWTFAIYDYWADEAVQGQTVNILHNWNLEISYSTTEPRVGLWSPSAGLYTNAELTDAYVSGDLRHNVFASPSQSANYTLVEQYTGCSSNPVSIPVMVSTPSSASISYPGGPFCFKDNQPKSVSLTGSNGGVFSSVSGLTLNTGNGQVIPLTSTPGTYTVTYSIPATGVCPAFNTTANVTIQGTTYTTLPAVTSLNSYSWNGSTYTTSGSYTHTLTSSTNCDSAVILPLIILPQDVSIYPNPSNGVFQIVLKDENGLLLQQASINIYDSRGRKVFTQQANAPGTGIIQVNLSGLMRGIYRLEMANTSGKRITSHNLILL